jgi:hypothetical protein
LLSHRGSCPRGGEASASLPELTGLGLLGLWRLRLAALLAAWLGLLARNSP